MTFYDRQPPLLPVSLQLSDIGPLPVRPTVVSASLAVPHWEDGPTISGVGPDVVAFPELGVAPLVDSGTDLEDELSTLDGSPSTDAIKTGEVVLAEVRPAPRGVIDIELEKALLLVSILLMMMTPIVDPVVGGGWKSGPGCLSVVPGIACWLSVWADHLPDLAVFADGLCFQDAIRSGHDGPVLAAG